MKRSEDVEIALRWAYRDELPKLGEEYGGAAGYAAGFSPAAIARSMTTDYIPHYPAALGRPHPDAVRIGKAVDRLERKAFGFDASDPAIACDLAPECFRYIREADPILSQFYVDIGPLVAMHAKMGTRPPWEVEFSLTPQFYASGGKHVMIGRRIDQRRIVYEKGSRCPLVIAPDPREVVSDRGEYLCWHRALAQLTRELEGTLDTIDVLPPEAPERPWLTGAEKPKTILRDLTKDWDAPKRRPLHRSRHVAA